MKIEKIQVVDKQYEIKRVYKRHEFSNEQKLVEIKNTLGYDALIKNEQFYFLCNEIIDVEYTEIRKEDLNAYNEELKLQKEINS